MGNIGGGAKIINDAGYAQSGKLVLSLENLEVLPGASRVFLLSNLSPYVLYINQVERFESELVSYALDGLSSMDLDFVYNADLTGSSIVPYVGAQVYSVTSKGFLIDLDPSLFSFEELLNFNLSASSNRKIELSTNNVSFFSTNQSTAVAEKSKQKSFINPYALAPNLSLVVFFVNENKIGNLTVINDLLLTGYAL